MKSRQAPGPLSDPFYQSHYQAISVQSSEQINGADSALLQHGRGEDGERVLCAHLERRQRTEKGREIRVQLHPSRREVNRGFAA